MRDAVGDVKDDLKTHYLSKSEFYKVRGGGGDSSLDCGG